MESKEKIEYLEQLYHSKRRSGNTSVKEHNTIEEIINDLEVLEILKRTKLDLWQFKKYIDYRNYCCLEMLSEKEFYLVWEWLNNDK